MKRKLFLQESVDSVNNNCSRAELNKINAKIKIAYAELRQKKNGERSAANLMRESQILNYGKL